MRPRSRRSLPSGFATHRFTGRTDRIPVGKKINQAAARRPVRHGDHNARVGLVGERAHLTVGDARDPDIGVTAIVG